jgi:dimethylargininase
MREARDASGSARRVALTREISPAIARCELTHLARVPIDVHAARAQHREYERCLEALGCKVQRLEAGPDVPDSVFIEDIAVVFDELAVITRPGAESRRAEIPAIDLALVHHRTLRYIDGPGTLDGGDVLTVGRDVFVGESARTNAAGIEQLRRILAEHAYTVRCVPVNECLHLKSAVSVIRDDLLLINRAWTAPQTFAAYELLDIDAREPFAANALRVGDEVVYPAEFPRTRDRLDARGIGVHAVRASELAKAEGAVTCCSLVFPACLDHLKPTQP